MSKIVIFDDASVPPGVAQVAINLNDVIGIAHATSVDAETGEKTKADGILALYIRNREPVVFVRGDFDGVVATWEAITNG